MESEDDIYLNARELTDAAERARYLDQACGADVGLRKRVEAMLRDATGAEAFFQPIEEATSGPPGPEGVAEAPGTLIGRYRLIEKLGEGGMGVVYRAEQQEPVQRQVALKIIKLGMDTRQVVARFEAERQALALMDHPNIAKVLDGGAVGDERTADPRSADFNPQGDADRPELAPNSDPSSNRAVRRTEVRAPSGLGRPYFVMELVEGLPITEFCTREQLALEQRLRLFIPVCQAVQHAHQKGIIHRDLKPSNVMVTIQDGVPVAKVIDFGVAKALHQRLTEKTLFTQHATLIGTPAYMSPEQAELGGADVDTRSDVYSLGVLLYELLTGTQPFPEQRLRSVAYAEMQRIILHEEPERPSTRLRKTAATAAPSPPAADHRSRATRPRPLITDHRLLATDLDWIVLKSLEKDRNRRYETANGLAADVRRFLSNEPIVARPPSRWYEFRKTVRRHKVGFVTTAAVMLALAAGGVVSGWQAVRAREAESVAREQGERASRERALAEQRLHATVELMNAAFTNVMPALRHTIGATRPREYLAKTAAGIAQELLRDGAPDPEMRRVVGQLYLQLAMVQGYYTGATTGEYDEALESARKAIQFFQPSGREGLNDEAVDRLIWAEMCAGFAAQGLLRFEVALDHFGRMREWSATLAQSSNPNFANLGQVKLHWAQHLTGETVFRMGQAEVAMENYFLPLVEQITRREVHDEEGRWQVTEDLRDAYDAVGRCLGRLGQRERAEHWFRRALPLAEALAESHPSHAGYACYPVLSRARLGEVLLARARPDEALPLLASAVQLTQSLQKRDPANPGFVQLEVEVLQCHVGGYAGWAVDESATPVERRRRLDRAEAYLREAERAVVALASESLRNCLRHELDATVAQLLEIRAQVELLPAP